MNDHLDPVLERYLDGELRPEQARAAGVHLAGCADCRAGLARLQALRALLAQAPAAEGLKPESRFAAEVGLRLERRAPVSASPSVAAVLWHLIPLGLALTLAFLEAVTLTAMLIDLIPGADQALQGLTAGASLPGLGAFLPAPLGDLAGLVGELGFSLWNPLTGATALAAAGLIALGWLASWYARYQHAAPGRD